MTISSSSVDVIAPSLDIRINHESSTKALLVAETGEFQCAIGKGGAAQNKVEGDGKTPLGIFHFRRVFYRPDRWETPISGLPVRALRPDDGWSDDPSRPEYNTLVRLPYDGSHEKMWREDNLYDVVVEIGYNDKPPMPGKGSAIFMHLARPHFMPTEGCIAVSKTSMIQLLPLLQPSSTIRMQLVTDAGPNRL